MGGDPNHLLTGMILQVRPYLAYHLLRCLIGTFLGSKYRTSGGATGCFEVYTLTKSWFLWEKKGTLKIRFVKVFHGKCSPLKVQTASSLKWFKDQSFLGHPEKTMCNCPTENKHRPLNLKVGLLPVINIDKWGEITTITGVIGVITPPIITYNSIYNWSGPTS